MNKKELASLLNGREYGDEITPTEAQIANQSKLVVVFGRSDDLMEFRGAIDDELGSGEVFIDRDGIFEECPEECSHSIKALSKAKPIKSVWNQDGWSWHYITSIPHETFEIREDEKKYCKGIVFSLDKLE